MKKIILKKGKEEAVRRFHPWVFSGAIQSTEGGIVDGDLIEVLDFKNTFLAIGYYNAGSIAVRILSFSKRDIDLNFWIFKIKNAYEYRKNIGVIGSKSTTCYRLIHAEGDGLPGLIIDIYEQVAVIQCHSIGIFKQIEHIKNALLAVFKKEGKLVAIYDKSSETLPPQLKSENQYIYGTIDTPQIVLENDCRFAIDWETGQKTGFFLDQRDNRQLLSRYVNDKTVLNAFCYSGGFSIYALKGGAKSVHSVDISQKAIDLTDKNVEINGFTGKNHVSTAADVLQFLKDNKNIYDVMVVDPPAFAKSIAKRHNAVQAYKRLNAMALRQITEGGILFTFSCSQVVDTQLFYDTIVAAAIEAGRRIRVMHKLTQPADHPVNIFHPEGAYLKGLVLYVE
jgi:23S rRNA (cytosine1962-C5)-methyltransferase